MLKKVLIGLFALIIVIGIAGNYIFSNLDHFVKQAIEKYGTAATRATVHVSSVNISLATGTGTLDNLTVGNPPGFKSEHSFSLGSIKLTVDTGSVRGNGPIVIKNIDIDNPQIVYEMNAANENNLQTIVRNTQSYASAPVNKQAAANPQSPAESEQGRKLIIDELTVNGAKVTATEDLLANKNFTATLPPVHLTDIGKSTNGATAAEVTRQIVSELSLQAEKVAQQELMKQLSNQLNTDVKNKINEKLNSMPQLKGLLGGSH